jgi:hypothetical protein
MTSREVMSCREHRPVMTTTWVALRRVSAECDECNGQQMQAMGVAQRPQREEVGRAKRCSE